MKTYKHKYGALPRITFYFIFIFLIQGIFGCSDDDDNITPREEKTQSIDLALIAENMVSPVGLVASPDDSDRLFVIDQVGKIWIIENDTRLEEPFLDVSSLMVSLNSNYDERGLLGLAFHPDYSSNGRLFVYYTAPPNAGGPGENGWNNISRISEFTVSGSDPNQVNLGSEKIILQVDQPQGNHEGGTVAFGPDGYLYISIGDGGNAHDIGPGHVEDWYEENEGGNGQDIEDNLLGSILRIDIDSGDPYSIPGDNPFVNTDGRDEIYAYGFRNPFRFSFDMDGSNQLLVGDAGQNLWEEVSLVEKGGNYGWNVKEGTHCFSVAEPEVVDAISSCPEVDVYGNELIDPVIEMANANNPQGGSTITIIGGNVYRGNAIPAYAGKYIFGSFAGDFTPSGEVFIATPAGQSLWSFNEIDFKSRTDNLGEFLKGFGQDNNGEIYLATSENIGPQGETGKIYKIVLVDD